MEENKEATLPFKFLEIGASKEDTWESIPKGKLKILFNHLPRLEIISFKENTFPKLTEDEVFLESIKALNRKISFVKDIEQRKGYDTLKPLLKDALIHLTSSLM